MYPLSALEFHILENASTCMATDIYAFDYKVENVVISWLCIALAFQYKVTKSLVNVLDLFCDLSKFTCSYFIYNLIVSTLFLSPQVYVITFMLWI